MLLIVSENSVGQRIDNFLFSRLKGVPKTRVYKMIRKGEVRVDSKRIDASFKLQEGQKIRIPPVRIATRDFNSPTGKNNSNTIAFFKKKIEIIDEKNGLFIVNKPAGIAVHGGSGKSYGLIECLRILKKQPNLQLVHRLDKETSGLILVSTNRLALLNLHRQLREGRVKKTYLACSQGKIEIGSQLVVKKPLMRFYNDKGERMVKIDNNGQYAATKIKSLKSFKHKELGWLSLLECQPLTGRTHQIRVHLQSLNLPILGDKRYGEFDKICSQVQTRMFLHAWKLRFCDLGGEMKLEYVADIPAAFLKVFPGFNFSKKNK